MKKYLSSIILGVIIVILAVAIGCLYFSNKKETTENTNIPVETSEPVETATPEPTPTTEPTPEPTAEPTEEHTEEPNQVSIDYADIDPEIHSTMSDGKVEVDETLLNTMITKCPYFTSKHLNEEEVKQVLEVFLKYYYNGIMDKDEWFKFATTGDKLSFWSDFTDEDILFVHDTEMAAWERWSNTEEGQEALKNDPNYELWLKTQELLANENDEEFYKQIAEELGITPEEVKVMLEAEEARQNSPYMSDRHGFNVGDKTTLDSGITVAYQGEDLWKDVSSNKLYKTTRENEDGSMWFEVVPSNPDSPYLSERNGFNVGDTTTISTGVTLVYQGNDTWLDTSSNTTYIVTQDLGNGSMWFEPQVSNTEPEDTTPSNPTHYADDCGYKVGDTVSGQSEGQPLTLTYLGNDEWIDDYGNIWMSYDNGNGGIRWFKWN